MLEKFRLLKKHPMLAYILEMIVFCAIAFLCAWLLTTFVLLNGHVPSKSMENIIMKDDKIVANRLQYFFSNPKRGDIVVFHSPDQKAQNAESFYVKRIIGLPGDSIVIRANSVYVNGQLLEEPYLDVETQGDAGPFIVPEDSYFVMGDNRNESEDSRHWVHKYVPRKDILGKVFLKYSLSFDNFHFKFVKSYNDYDLQ